jgi:hypothetical protein
MAQPIVKYTLNKKGQTPEWINTSDSSFAGEHGITGNKTGYIPKYESPQDTIYLGIASGDPDPDGTPDDYVGIITTKALLQTYITETGSTLQYKTTTPTVTGIQTAIITGLATAFGQTEYSGGLSTTTSTKYTASGVGTVATISASAVTKVVVATDTTTGSSDATTETPIVIDAASTLSGVSTSSSVGVVTTTEPTTGLAVTTTTTTYTTSFTYTDVSTSSSTSTSSTTTDGVTTRTDTVTTTETTNYETSYDYAAEATRLWDIYTALNS